ncbi:hypothetical protein I3760_12G093200 [Carya illinoinensis]|uniref:Salutaridine reductase n=1 Tax=Carya illinoinensis TaxID=32201 RepID=A0A8T1NUL1_CARIL|nr:hypothetical protein I3760_12G093200 [Carya illinoinensis]KAG6634105.1 hypothetical protein CIPAW_12G095800 [Carya illinoinensis]
MGENAMSFRTILRQTYELTMSCLQTNYYGNKLVCKALIPLLQLSNSPRIVNVSSLFGQLQFVSNENARKELRNVDELTEEKVDKVVEGFLEDVKENLIDIKGWPTNYYAYIVSKAALNAYARVLGKNYPNIAINSVHPVYVKRTLLTTPG